jgi:hypothetical protein
MKSAGVLPTQIGDHWSAPPLDEFNLTVEQAERVLSNLHLAVNHGWMSPVDFFQSVLAINGLTQIHPENV